MADIQSATAEISWGKKEELECGPKPNMMATQPIIGGAVCESCVIPFLVIRRKIWLMPTAGVPCSNAANIRERKTWTQSEFCTRQNSIRGKSPQKCIYTAPAQETAKHRAKFGWPVVSDVAAVTKARCKTCWNFLGCPKLVNRSQPLVGWSSPYCEDMWRRCCCLTGFFSDCRYMPSLRRYSVIKLCDGAQMANFWQFFGSCIFSEPHAAHFRPGS